MLGRRRQMADSMVTSGPISLRPPGRTDPNETLALIDKIHIVPPESCVTPPALSSGDKQPKSVLVSP